MDAGRKHARRRCKQTWRTVNVTRNGVIPGDGHQPAWDLVPKGVASSLSLSLLWV